MSEIALSAALSASLDARLLRPPPERADPTDPLRLRPPRDFCAPAPSCFFVDLLFFLLVLILLVVAPPFRVREAEEEEEEAEASEWYEWAAIEEADDEESYGLW